MIAGMLEDNHATMSHEWAASMLEKWHAKTLAE